MKYSLKRNSATGRITLLQVLFFVFILIIVVKLFYLQIIKHNYYENLASQRHFSLEELKPDRGEIFVLDSQGQKILIASNQQHYLLYGVPSLIGKPTTTIALIEKVLPMNDEERWQTFLKLDKSKDPYEPLQHNITQIQKDRLEKIFENIEPKVIGFQKEVKRVYPQSNLYSHVLGFIGYANDQRVGQYGIEEYFEKELAGQGGMSKIEKDPKGRLISFGENEFDTLESGADILLTLDPTIQFKACEIIKNWQEKMLAEDGSLIVINPNTGDILAMCNTPDFDLNNYNQVEDINIYFNKIVNEAYEPGSVFKPITMAAALDLEKVTPETEYFDEGFLKFGRDTIHNANNKTYGHVNMTQVLENSINTGVASMAVEKIGQKNLKKYVENFGFGEKTNINLPVEALGDISSLNKKSDIYIATASYGQGIMTTPLQLITAFSAIANGGILMQPKIVKQINFSNGEIEERENKQVRRVITSKTANLLKAMLVSVIKNGQAKRAGVAGYYVAGKTGTANIADKSGGYSEQTNHTFVGFAPVNSPKFVILVKLSKPKNVPFSSDSAAPAFGQMTEFLLQYYQIPPDF
ncbi:peptidoglycan D,D-transpeptidase FtsI family protein [Patescibacteria group bacterium]